MVILETERLILRRQTPSDLEDLYALYCDPEIVRYVPDAPRSYDEAREELEWHMNGHPRNPQLGLWATVFKPNGRFIGRCGLLPWTIEGREAVEVAYLIERAYWGQGLGSEAAQAIAQYAFEQLGLQRLVCTVLPGNTASARVAEKIGMHLEREMEDEHGPFLLFSMERL